MIRKVSYNAMDLVKFLSSILLVCAHTAAERVELPSVLDLFCSMYIVVVPFFFIASSFLFYRKLDGLSDQEIKILFRKYSTRIGIMYLAWSLIYICFVCVNWIQEESNWNDIFKYFHHAIVYSTYPTIWFLPALWIGVSLVYLCRYKWNLSYNTILVISLLFYFIGAIEYSYHSLTSFTESIHQFYKIVFVTWRNGLFNAFVYAVLGGIIAMNGLCSLKKSLLGTLTFGVAFVIEAFIMKRIVPSADANFLFMLVPFSYFFFSLICQIKLPDSCIYIPLRKMSMLIFASQRLFLTAIPSIVLPGYITGPWDITNNGIFALIMVVMEVSFFAFILMLVSKKFKVFRYLM